MKKILLQTIEKLFDDIVKNYVHDDNVDDEISDILEKIYELKRKIEWTL